MLVALSFFIYDWFVRARQNKMVATAAHTNSLVTNLFPGQLRDKMLERGNGMEKKQIEGGMEQDGEGILAGRLRA